MTTLRTVIFAVWGVFWIYWLISALGAKASTSRSWRTTWRTRPVGLLIVGLGVLTGRVLRGNNALTVHTPALQVVGVIVFVSGLALAVWARIHLGRNWGMPMTERAEPELVTSGPYRFVRHPIYSGILLGLLGTGLATSLYWLIGFGVALVYFTYSATVEERTLTATFPDTYPKYKAHTKMLIPFLL
jgi:protein-S-isoprenylcysteine O-methyltransferase Ste14